MLSSVCLSPPLPRPLGEDGEASARAQDCIQPFLLTDRLWRRRRLFTKATLRAWQWKQGSRSSIGTWQCCNITFGASLQSFVSPPRTLFLFRSHSINGVTFTRMASSRSSLAPSLASMPATEAPSTPTGSSTASAQLESALPFPLEMAAGAALCRHSVH